ncbi:MAG: ABC transporter ATP-binding protein [Gammaproteobacteria bacterium]
MTVARERAGKTVHLRGVGKRFGRVTAVDNIDIGIAAGEFCTLLGPSGSGKTTLLRIIAGYEAPTVGAVIVDGHDVSKTPVAKRDIGMVFQNYALFPHMTVARNIAFPLEMRHYSAFVTRERVAGALALVDLVGFGERYPRQLSGGQQQRVALARALVFDPDILLMDEPLGALDKNLRQAMQLELKRLHRRLGVTIVYVTHDQEEAMYLSDRIVVLNGGRIEQAGEPEALYNRPGNVFVANFLGECNLSEAVLESDETCARLKLASGITFDLRVTDRAIGNGQVTVGVRPERLRLGDQARACANRAVGVVEDIVFLGTGYKVLVRLAEATWVVSAVNQGDPPAFEPGDRVDIGFAEADVFFLAGT